MSDKAQRILISPQRYARTPSAIIIANRYQRLKPPNEEDKGEAQAEEVAQLTKASLLGIPTELRYFSLLGHPSDPLGSMSRVRQLLTSIRPLETKSSTKLY